VNVIKNDRFTKTWRFREADIAPNHALKDLCSEEDERSSLTCPGCHDSLSFFGTQVFQSVIPRNVRLAEAPSFGKPIIFYDIHSKGAEGYTQLAQEVIANAEKRAGTGARSAHSGA